MRFPWQPKPGMVRISHRKLIDLLRGALRASELEHKVRALQVGTSRLEAQAQLITLTLVEREAVAFVADQPPLTADGSLHQAAFEALVAAAVEEQRAKQREPLRVVQLNRSNG